MPRARTAIFAIILAALTFAAFWRVLDAEFVRWDDNVTIFENQNLGDFSPGRLYWALTDVRTTMRYVPLSLLSWIATHQIFKMHPLGYHLGNLLLHAASASMLFLVFARLISGNTPARSQDWPTTIAAAIGAALWGLHPMRVEPVAWCTARTYDLAMFFAVLCVWCYLRAAEPDHSSQIQPGQNRHRVWFVSAVALYAASLLSHPIGLGLVAVLLLIDVFVVRGRDWRWSLRDPQTRRALLMKLPFVGASALVLGLSLLARFHQSELYSGQAVSLSQFGVHKRILQAFYLWAYYGWRPFWPVDLTPMRTELMSFQSTDARFSLSMLAVVAATALAFNLGRRFPAMLGVWLFHLAILVPALGWTEHPHYPADRYSILAGCAWPLLVAAGLRHVSRRSATAFITGATTAFVIASLLVALTIRQTVVWRDSMSLFTHMLNVLGDDPYRADIHARIGLLHAYATPPDYARASESFEQGLAANPSDYRIRLMLADVWTREHRHNAAVMLLRDGLSIAPENFDLRLFLAWTLHRGKRHQEAMAEFEQLSRLKPDHSDVKLGLSEARKALNPSIHRP